MKGWLLEFIESNIYTLDVRGLQIKAKFDLSTAQ
jgi:hypothetical protein